ncbi:hypothetical protein BREVUG8_60102 [Brevundimonas sp. G8]|nr:hypothetical protein BREVUG8_60102 [Brevundimonas sp. G8]
MILLPSGEKVARGAGRMRGLPDTNVAVAAKNSTVETSARRHDERGSDPVGDAAKPTTGRAEVSTTGAGRRSDLGLRLS